MKGKKISYYSQFSEDAIIAGLFRKIGTTNKRLVDIGAADGKTFSNTLHFIELDWSGVFVEPEEECFERLSKLHPQGKCFNLAIDSETTIDKFLSSFDYPKTFDLLNIDIDGQDFYAWLDMVEYRARIVVIEWSPYVDKCFVPKRDTDGKNGKNQAGLLTMLRLAGKKDYTVTAVTPVNLICVDNNLLPQKYWQGYFPMNP